MAKLPPLPANHTARLFLDYTAWDQPHTAIFRFKAGITDADAVAALVETGFIAALPSLWVEGTTVTGARWQAKDAEFSLPIDATDLMTEGSIVPLLDPASHVTAFSWAMHSLSSPRKGRLMLFGFNAPDDQTFRLTGSEKAVYAALHSAIVSLASTDNICTIDGSSCLVRDYINISYNAHFQRKSRD